MHKNQTPGHNLLVTLLCPRCKHRVGVMAYFPFSIKTVKPGDISLLDGTPVQNPDKLCCRHCFQVFPAKAAAIPQYLLDAATGELARLQREAEETADALPA